MFVVFSLLSLCLCLCFGSSFVLLLSLVRSLKCLLNYWKKNIIIII